MKKIFSIFAAFFFAGSLMAESVTCTFSGSGTVTTDVITVNSVEWTIATVVGNGSPTTAYGNAYSKTAIKFGAGAKNCYSSVTLSTPYFKNLGGKKVTKVEVEGLGSAKKNVKFSIGSENTTVEVFANAWTPLALEDLDVTDDLVLKFELDGAGFFVHEIKITYEDGAAPAVAKPTITPAANPFVGSTSVTLACETAGATIYYTTNGDDPDDSSEEYDGTPFSIDATTTVKAIASDGSNWSEIASKTIESVPLLTTMDEIFEAATDAAKTQYIAFDEWIVTGVSSNGKNVFVTDGTKGFVINDGGGAMGFEAGDILEGTVQVSLKKNSGYAQVSGIKASTTGLTVDKGGVPTLNVLDADGIALLTGVNTGSLIQIKGAYSTTGTNKHFVAGVQVFCGNSGICASYPEEFNADSEYKVTGVYQIYSTTNEVLPRALTDIEEVITGPAIKADNIELGEIFVVDDNPYETFIGLVVTGINLTEDIVASTSSEGLTIVSQTLNKDGGSVEVNIQAPLGVFEGTISLTSGDLIKPVKVTATIRKKNVEPASAVDPIVDPSKGTNASEVAVQTDGDEYTGVKVGKTDADGSLPIVVGPGAETLYFYALAWNGSDGKNIQLSAPAGVTLWAPEMDADGKIALMASSDIAGGAATFTISDIALEDLYKCLYAISLTGVTAQTTITVSSGSARRFVLFGIKQVGGSPATALEDVTVENTAVKQIINNQVIITRDGVRYNVIGQIVK